MTKDVYAERPVQAPGLMFADFAIAIHDLVAERVGARFTIADGRVYWEHHPYSATMLRATTHVIIELYASGVVCAPPLTVNFARRQIETVAAIVRDHLTSIESRSRIAS